MIENNALMIVTYAVKYKERVEAILNAFNDLKRYIDESTILYKDINEPLMEDICSLAHFDGICEASGSQIDMVNDMLKDFIQEHHLGKISDVKH